jgi:hypothetical protein
MSLEDMANAKGTVMVGLVKALRKNKERAREVLPARLAHYLEERIVLASWYPLEDYLELTRAAAKVMPNAGPDVFEKMGRLSAREHMEGTYSRLKKSVSRQAAHTLLSALYDSGEMSVVEREPGHAVIDFARFALPAREICENFTGYHAERMTIQGFEDVRVRHVSCRAEGAPSCRWDIKWKGGKRL